MNKAACFMIVTLSILCVGLLYGQDPKKVDVPEKGDTAAKLRSKAAKEEESSNEVGLKITVPKDVKIEIDGKSISYEKFAAVIEFTGRALEVDEIQWKEGKFTVLKMKNKQ